MSETRAAAVRRLEQEVGVLARRVRRVIDERALAVHDDLQPASYLMLSYLAEHGPLRASAMADLFHLDKGAISRQVGHLQQLGLVERTPDPADGRAHLVAATPEAVTRLERVARTRRAFLEQRLDDWDDDELSAFVTTLGRYNEALDRSARPGRD